MTHIEPEVLAEHALDSSEELDESVRSHLAVCRLCQDQYAELRRVVGAAASSPRLDALEQPPPHLWQQVRQGVGNPGPGAQRSPRRLPRLLAAVVVGILVGGSAVLGWQQLDDQTTEGSVSVIASGPLDQFGDRPVNGHARIVDRDGRRELDVVLDERVDSAGYVEVWLLNRDATKLLSVGIMSGSQGTFTLPAGVDTKALSVVDISLEPYDGDPQHSGDSLARGDLTP